MKRKFEESSKDSLHPNVSTKQSLDAKKIKHIDLPMKKSSNPVDETQIVDTDEIEPFLDAKNKRGKLYPILYPDLWDFYIKHKAAFWQAEELSFAQDKKDWVDKLTDDDRHFIKYVLAFFAASDFIVNENITADGDEVEIMEYQFFSRFKGMMEDIHSITYANLINAYISNQKEKDLLFEGVKTISTIQKKADWSYKHIEQSNWKTRLVAFAIVEGIFFSGSFCAIFWLRKRQLMPGLCIANDFISRDEGLHRDFAALVYRKYVIHKLPEQEVIDIIKEAVSIEQEFCCEALPVSLIGMNKTSMSSYIEFVADCLAVTLINKKIYNVQNPFDFMQMQGMTLKDDFFTHRPSSYANQAVLNTSDTGNDILYDEDF